MPIFHVDSNNGDDKRDGVSPARAWKTLKQASRRVYKPSDQLILKRGGVFNGGLKLKGMAPAAFPIVLSAYGVGARPVIHGLQDHAISATAPIAGWHISSLELTSQNNKNPGLRIGGGTCGVYFSQKEHSESLRIEDCLIHHCSGPGIHLAAGGPAKAVFSNVVIEHCQIHHASCGIQFGGAGDGFHTDYFSNFRIAHVTVHDIGGDGIVPFCSNNGVVEYCTAYRTGLGVHPKDHSPVAIWYAWAKNCVIQYCEAFDNHAAGLSGDGGGFDIDGGCTGCVLQYNYLHDNDGAGYLLCSWDPKKWPTKDCVCRFNLSINDGLANDYASIEFWQADSFQVYNNTCVTRKSSPLKFISPTKGHLIANNIFMVDSWDDVAVVKSTFDVSRNNFRNNLYYRRGGGLRFDMGSGKALASLKAFDKLVKGRGQIHADPGLIAPFLQKFQVGAKSPALGAGKGIAKNGGRDYYGAALNGKPFMGAAGKRA